MVQPGDGNPIVFFDITLGGEPLGRIKMELYSKVTPRTCQNFHAYCVGSTKSALGRPLGYKGSKFHRVIKDFMIQGGDFLNGDGTGSTCVFGTKSFADENFELKHDRAGLLSMANSGKDTNGCQFFITTKEARFLDGKHVVFGRVIPADEGGGDGLDVVRKVENVRTRHDKPALDVVIAECGEM